MYEEAIKEYSEILSEFPYFSEAAFYVGLTYFKQKDIEGAAEYFKKALLKHRDAALIADPESGTERLLAVLPSFGDKSVFNLIISTWS